MPDPERPRAANAFDKDHGYSGQGYHRDHEAAEGERAADPPAAAPEQGAGLPPDNGRRAGVDPATGEVRGSGMSAGGGQAGEDLSPEAAAGEGYPLTGGEGGDHAPGDLGPTNDRASYL